MNVRSDRKTVLITGAGGVLGSELALACARGGWETVLLDQSMEPLERVRKRIVEAANIEPIMQTLDLSDLDPQNCARIVDGLERGPGRLDGLIHCAAAFEGLRPLDQVEPHVWLRDFHVNVHAVWLLTVQCLPLLRQARAGNLIFVIDQLQKMAGAYWGSYGVAQWAVDAMSAQFAAELDRTRVRVLAVDPGPMPSPLRARAYQTEDPTALQLPSKPAQKIFTWMESPSVPSDRRMVLSA